MPFTLKKAVAGLAVAGTLTLAGATPALADSGPGTSLCQAVPAADMDLWPAAGPLYNFVQPPPAADVAFVQICLD